MPVKTLGLLFIGLMLAACAVVQSGRIQKIALLAPFEGQYRAIGYNGLYALRLALADVSSRNIQLLAVDDGGTAATAIKRMQALNLDPAVAAVLILGEAASHPTVQQVNSKPLIIIGSWGHDSADMDTLYAAHPSVAGLDSDLLLLGQAADWAEGRAALVSSGRTADDAFRERYMRLDDHAPPPNLLAMATYDMARLTLAALADEVAIDEARHDGLHGAIQFVDGYWHDAPLNLFRYEDGQPVMLD